MDIFVVVVVVGAGTSNDVVPILLDLLISTVHYIEPEFFVSYFMYPSHHLTILSIDSVIQYWMALSLTTAFFFFWQPPPYKNKQILALALAYFSPCTQWVRCLFNLQSIITYLQ